VSLKTYDRDFDHVNDEILPWPFNVIDEDGVIVIDSWHDIVPGKWVTHKTAGGKGLVIAVTDDQLTVLWSDPPGITGFSNIAFPIIRRVQPALIRNELVGIQPMTAPTGLIFYMDYTYGDDIDKKCSEGPLWDRLRWKAVRLWRTRIRSQLSSLSSWCRSRFGKKLSSSENRVFGPKLTQDDLIIKATIERMAKGDQASGSRFFRR